MNQISVEVARSFRQRLRGLIGRKLGPGHAMLFPSCRSVHGFFMDRPLDCVFLDGRGCILEVGVLRPWRVLSGPRGCMSVLELEVGDASKLDLRPGLWLLPGAKAGVLVVAELPEEAITQP